MKYIYFLLNKIPQLQNILPREIWLLVGDQQIKMFKERLSAFKLWRYFIRQSTHHFYKVGMPKQIYIDHDNLLVIYAFEHQKHVRGPLLTWEVVMRKGRFDTEHLVAINFSIYGRVCESFSEFYRIY